MQIGLLKLHIIRRRSVVGVSLYLPSLLLRRRVRLYFIALLGFSRRGSFKLSKSELNTKSRLLKLRTRFNGNSKRKRRNV